MLGLIVAGIIAWQLISYIDKKRDGCIEVFTIVTFLVVPSIIIFISTFIGFYLEISSLWLLPAQALFFVVPFSICRFQLDYGYGISAAYGGIVFGVNILVSLTFLLLFGA